MLSQGDTLSGFTVRSVEEIPEQRGFGIWCVHKATGLELFHLFNDDPENFFSFNFRTIPKNSKGTAHIVEHAVLAGSQHIPVKDPFQEILKGSAQTFLNAMTYPDRTVYPGASPIRKDYFNLMKVYGDAVFYPLLKRETFMQEGIRVSVMEDRELEFQGIVFNEMKGSYSHHDSIVAEESLRRLFPDTPMQHDSGGDPRRIVELTYQEFKGFHAENYHPSNCRIFLYGSIPTEDQLAFLQKEFLSEFTGIKAGHDLPNPKRWQKPKRALATSPADDEQEGALSSSITVNWLTREVTNPVDVVTYEILTELLLGNPGAPVYQAIIDSEIGSDISPLSGMEGDLKEIVFTLGVRGTVPERADAFETLVFKVLKKLVRSGLPKDQVASAMKKIEFQHREIKGGIPQGLRCMIRSMRGWNYGLPPSSSLQFVPAMERVKQLWKEDPKYFAKVIKRDLIDNPHRVTVIVRPDSGHDPQFESSLTKHLDEVKASCTKKDYIQLRRDQEALEEHHNTSDSPEALQQVPRLGIEDLPREIRRLDTLEDSVNGVPFLVHRYHTNEICYVDYLFNTRGLGEDEQMLLPLLSRLIYTTSMGSMTYGEVSSTLASLTGGFYSMMDISTPLGSDEDQAEEYLIFRAKFLEDDRSAAMSFIHRLLLKSNLGDLRRLKDIILEAKQDYSVSLLSSGNAFAALRSDSRLSRVQYREENWKGLSQYLFLQDIDCSSTQVLQDIAGQLEALRMKLFSRQRALFNVTCQEEHISAVRHELGSLVPLLTDRSETLVCRLPSVQYRKGESLIVPSQVAYCAYSMQSGLPGSVEQLHQGILTAVLSSEYLYEHVRLRGGAYGVGASMNLLEGLITFTSYRDPHIARTISAYQAALSETAAKGISERSLERALISLVSREIRPMSPNERGVLAFRRWLYGITDEVRIARREQTLETTVEDVRREAQRLSEQFHQGSAAVLGGRDLLKRSGKGMDDLLSFQTVIHL